MKISKNENFDLFKKLKVSLNLYTNEEIESGLMEYCLEKYGYKTNSCKNNNINHVIKCLKNYQLSSDLETIIGFFEFLIDNDDKIKNGIFFTPKYIAEYITTITMSDYADDLKSVNIIDPGCGCGIFLVTAAEYLYKKTGLPIDEIIEKNIYGIDIFEDNARRSVLVMKLLSAKYGGSYETIKPNIISADCLKTEWKQLFNVNSFNCILGNPPYINPHNMNNDTIKFLKESFYTTKEGTINIFYAFLEKGIIELNNKGSLSFIVPNNFLTIKSAKILREYLQKNNLIYKILDFGDNMVFNPIRTYNCIISLNFNKKEYFEYTVLKNTDDINKSISNCSYNKMKISHLNKNGWNLVDNNTRKNVIKIESQLIPIKNFIRTGIATLNDKVYIVNKDDIGYYKIINNEKYYIENDLIKPLFKVSELKKHDNANEVKKYIIFPYQKSKDGYSLINEKIFLSEYPKTYNCLLKYRDILLLRDKGKIPHDEWYAYGRKQGLNKYGNKLLFPTFACKPKFVYINDQESLFCNGYAVFENDYFDLEILAKVLNSSIMDYYITNTSYSIEGGFYCYQKKYIENFSLPMFSNREIDFIRNSSQKELDKFLWDLYKLE